jgi:hypothetical protein
MSNWKNFPFTVDGINFNSRVDMDSPMGKNISRVPALTFTQMNEGAIRSIIGDASKLTRDELVSELARVNAGGTQAFLELA